MENVLSIYNASPSYKAKAAGFKNMQEIVDITGRNVMTLRNWSDYQPRLYDTILLGCKYSRTLNVDIVASFKDNIDKYDYSPSKQAVSVGFDSFAEVARISNKCSMTLRLWAKEQKQLYLILLLGCMKQKVMAKQ